MKVRLLTLVAVSATLLGTQAVAQQDDTSLERALADLNSGYLAPAAANVNATGSMGLNISGDTRVRNTWINPANALMPNLAASDIKNIDARLQLNLAFDVNEAATVFVQLNASENWGNAGIGTPSGFNVATGEGIALGTGANLNTGIVNQAYFTVYDIFGDGGEWRVGRSFFTFGSGRILATDNWNQVPDSYSGIWYTNSFEGVAVEAFLINDVFSGIGLNGSRTPSGDVDLYGLSLDFTTGDIDTLGIGELTIHPYVLRSSIQASPVNPAVGLPAAGGNKMWYGIEVGGVALDDVVVWDAEAVWVDVNTGGIPGPPSTSNFNAVAVDVEINLDQWTQDIPGGAGAAIELGFAASDNIGVTINPLYFDQAGLANVLGLSGIYAPGAAGGGAALPIAGFVGSATGGGVWNGLADVWQGALRLEPVEDWVFRIGLQSFDDNTAGTILPSDATEIDLSLDHTFEPSGLSMFLGWARVDFNALSRNAYVVYFVFGLPF